MLIKRCCTLIRSTETSGTPAASTTDLYVFGSSAAVPGAAVPSAQTPRPMLDLNEPPEQSSP